MQGNASGGEKFPSGNGRVLIWLIFLRMLARVPRCNAVSSSLRNRTIHSRPARRP